VVQTAWASDGLAVHVTCDQKLEVTASALHPLELSYATTGARFRRWSLVGGMVEGQGVYIAWEPRVGS
jgi:hypothetical protein